MSEKLIIRNGRILAGQPAAETTADLLIADGVIQEIGAVPPQEGAEVIDASGLLVLPGLVDFHAHFVADKPHGYRMLASAGVTTALDPIISNGDCLPPYVAAAPVGLNVAGLALIKAGSSVRTDNPDEDELRAMMEAAVASGCLGVKLAGAHFPLTPEATARAIKVAAELDIPLMIHAGSTAHRDDLAGMREIVELADGHPVCLAHVNIYCTGKELGSREAEALAALEMLRKNPAIISESTLSEYGCIGTRMVNDIPESLCMIDILTRLGHAGTYQGMLEAIEAGHLRVSMPQGSIYGFADIPSGLAYCREKHGLVTVGFRARGMLPNVMVASGKRDDGSFVVDAFSTDGGIIPRNIVLREGLALVAASLFTLPEFVRKASYAGARMMGLAHRKGVLAPGYDADIVLADPLRGSAEVTISGGHVIWRDGQPGEPCPDTIYALRPNRNGYPAVGPRGR